MSARPVCAKEERRELVRASRLNGIDFVELGEAVPGADDRRKLTVYFLGKAPDPPISPAHVHISGGKPVQVLNVSVHRNPEPDRDDSMAIVFEAPGDLSTYTLRLVAVDASGRPSPHPLPGLDPLYASIDFRFDAGCDAGMDCVPANPVCDSGQPAVRPEISYLAKDYGSFRQLMFDRLALIMPAWRERSAADFGIAMVELLAYTGDYLSYWQDAVATEAYLDTARRRVSVRRHARLVDYPMHDGVNARAWVFVETSLPWKLDPAAVLFSTRPPGIGEGATTITMTGLERLNQPVEYFEAIHCGSMQLFPEHNRIRIYTWGNKLCCLEKGATSAALALWPSPPQPPQEQQQQQQQKAKPQSSGPAPGLHLAKGDVIVFEEAKGPKSGDEDDADPSHRHAVRLIEVRECIDPLTQTPVWEVRWPEEDALPFPLCVSSMGPECELLEDVSIVRGNIVLVDHGRTIGPEDLAPVGARPIQPQCLDIGVKGDVRALPARYRPRLAYGPVVFSARADCHAPATVSLRQNPVDATAAVQLVSTAEPRTKWEARRDLLASAANDFHFVVETEDDGTATLRFGDGITGAALEPGMAFEASYRIGGGATGNAGHGAIALVVFRGAAQPPSGIKLSARNPLPAQGGTDPEPNEQVKLLAPHAFRTRLERAVVPADYAAIAQRDPRVQRAAATLRWTGSWWEVLLMLDPRSREQAGPKLVAEVAAAVEPFRRMGHDLVVAEARRIPICLKLLFCPKRHYQPAHLKMALREAFSNRILAGGRRGFFHPDNWSFGQGVALSAVYAAALAVEGVESVVVTELIRVGVDPPEFKGWIDDGLLALGADQVVQLDNNPSEPDHGIFDANPGGGGRL